MPSTPPSFQSTPTVWPLQNGQEAKGEATTTAGKGGRSRHRNRKKATKAASTSDGAPPPPLASPPSSKPTPSTSSSTPATTASAPVHRTNLPWRGSGKGKGRGGTNVGRGGGGVAAVQPTTIRSFSTAATKNVVNGETGVKVQRTPLFQSAQANAQEENRRRIQTDATATASTSTPPLDQQNGNGGYRRGGGPGGARGRGGGGGRMRGQGRFPPVVVDKGSALLEEVANRVGEEDLERQILTLYDIQRPSDESIEARKYLIEELTDYLNRERFAWGHPHSAAAMPLKIEPFGSVRFGLGTSTSDLDLCLLDPYRPNGFEEKWYSSRKEHLRDLPDIYQMRKIGVSLDRAGLSNIHPIPDAAVPICKFEVAIDGQVIQADLNTNERLGVYNSRLLNSYCNLHPLVRPLSVFIKFWASQRGLNNPSGDARGIVTFSSYTLILLVIAYLQKIELLPNLQAEDLIASTGTERHRFFSTPKAIFRRGQLKHLIRSVGWDVTFVEFDEPPPTKDYEMPEANLVQLARGFFEYFGDEFDLKKQVVSIANGKPFDRTRPFGHVPSKSIDGEEGEDGNKKAEEGDLSVAEKTRQEMEDLALEAFNEDQQEQAEQSERQQQQGLKQAELEAIDQAQAELDGEREQAQATRPRSNSNSSSPIPYGDFSEPGNWIEHMIVVQDPFILTRNCAGNVRPDWVEELRVEMRRARNLIDSKASLSKICLHHASDPDYFPIAFQRKQQERGGVSLYKLKRQERHAKKEEKWAAMRVEKEAKKKEERAAKLAARAEAEANGTSVTGSTTGATEGASGETGREASEEVSKEDKSEGKRDESIAETDPAGQESPPPSAIEAVKESRGAIEVEKQDENVEEAKVSEEEKIVEATNKPVS